MKVDTIRALIATHAPDVPRTTRTVTHHLIRREGANQDALPASLRRHKQRENDHNYKALWSFMKACAEQGISREQCLAHSYEHNGYLNHDPTYSEAKMQEQVHSAYQEVDQSRRRQQHDFDFWEARPLLKHIRDFAEGRRVAPWAMLGAVLVRVATIIPPVYVLPPLVGSYGSLNTFVGLVARSGGGKGTATKAAEDAIDFGKEVFTCPIGSGEGLNKGFGIRQGAGIPIWYRDALLVEANEVDSLAAQMGRGGATIGSELRSGWSGEMLGHGYSDPTKRLLIKPHRYRLNMLVGVQPRRAKALLDDASGGLFQRFLWLPANTDAPPLIRPRCPSQWTWGERDITFDDLEDAEELLMHLERPQSDLKVIAVPDVAAHETDAIRMRELRGELDPLDAHANMTRLKVAALLMWLDERYDTMTDEDWDLAGVVMGVSMQTRDDMLDEIKVAQQEVAIERGRSAALTERAKKDHTQQAQSVADGILRYLADGALTHNALKKKIPHRKRPLMADAVAQLIADDKVVERKTKFGTAYGLTEKGV